MQASTYTKSGLKTKIAVNLPASVFGVEAGSDTLLLKTYLAHRANTRANSAQTLSRGLVRGGGRKPWRQKGTGRARAGSIRSPLWRSGGVTFGPANDKNYTLKLSKSEKQTALRRALSQAAAEKRIIILETFECKEGKAKKTNELLDKLTAVRNILLVVSRKDELVARATRNLPSLKAVQAMYLNTYDVMNADTVIITKKSLNMLVNWLGAKE